MGNPKLTLDEVMERIKATMDDTDKCPDIIPETRRVGSRQEQQTHNFRGLDTEIRNTNLKWNIVTDLPITSHRKVLGIFLIAGKKIVRKCLSWYIKPIVDQQRDFNASATRSLNHLSELSRTQERKLCQIEAQYAEAERALKDLAVAKEHIDALINDQNDCIAEQLAKQAELFNRQIDSLRTLQETQEALYKKALDRARAEFLLQSEKRLNTMGTKLQYLEGKVAAIDGMHDVSTAHFCPSGDGKVEEQELVDYFLFEQKFRGSREEIKERQNIYLKYFDPGTKVVDMGCGRGEFLELLIMHGVNAIGVDSNQKQVDFCLSLGLPVIKADIFDFLEQQDDQSLDGIFTAQVIEHLAPDLLIRLINLSRLKLKPSGVLIMETINPQNLIAVSNWFYMDLSHVRPVHPETLRFLCEARGFVDIQLLMLHPDLAHQIQTSGDNSCASQQLNEMTERINSVLFGPQDYAIVARVAPDPGE